MATAKEKRMPFQVWQSNFSRTLWSMQEFLRHHSRGGECMETGFFGPVGLDFRGLSGKRPRCYIPLWTPENTQFWVPGPQHRNTGLNADVYVRIDLLPSAASVKAAIEFAERDGYHPNWLRPGPR